jgi:hypothetical protein
MIILAPSTQCRCIRFHHRVRLGPWSISKAQRNGREGAFMKDLKATPKMSGP